MIRKLDDGSYVISSNGMWVPGIFDSERAAKYAFKFPDGVLVKLQNSVNPGGKITFEMLQKARKVLR